MEAKDIVEVLLLFLPVVIYALKEDPTQEPNIVTESQTDGGSTKNYINILELGSRPYIAFALKSAENSHMLLSEKREEYINFGTDVQYSEIVIGG